MNLFYKTLSIIASIVIVSFMFSTIYSYYEYKSKSNILFEEQSKNDIDMLTNYINSKLANIERIGSFVVSDEKISQFYQDNDRQGLVSHVNNYWRRMSLEGIIDEMHFFKAPATSWVNFTNLNAPEKDISSIRRDIKDSSVSKHVNTHILVCRTYAGLRATFPITKDGQSLGGLGIGIKFQNFLAEIKQNFNLNLIIALNEKDLASLLPEAKSSIRSSGYLLNDSLLLSNVGPIAQEIYSKIDFTKDRSYIKSGERYLAVSVKHIYDFNKSEIGHFITYTDISNKIESLKHDFIKNIILKFIIILLVAAITIYIMNIILVNKVENINNLLPQKFSSSSSKSELEQIENKVTEILYELEIYLKCIKTDYIISHEETDELTGALKYDSFSKILEIESHKNKLTDSISYIASVDIDNLGELNDFYGREAGNNVIINLNSLISNYFSKHIYIICRHSGDMFLFILRGLAEENIGQIFSDIRKHLSKNMIYVSKDKSITYSFTSNYKIISNSAISNVDNFISDLLKKE